MAHFSVFVLSLWTAFLATGSFSRLKIFFWKEILQHNFDIDSIAIDEPALRNSCAEELKIRFLVLFCFVFFYLRSFF